jgi:hypothetical protein
MDVYVDDMLVKSLLPQDHTLDLQEAFMTLKKYEMMLNLSKCAFRVSPGKFLGYMVSSRGIEANPKKYLVSSPLLSQTVSGEVLYRYLTIFPTVVMQRDLVGCSEEQQIRNG